MEPFKWEPLSQETWQALKSVTFGQEHVDRFIQKDAWNLKNELLVQTWVLGDSASDEIYGFISFANSTIAAEATGKVRGLETYPSVHLKFMGVVPDYQRNPRLRFGRMMVRHWAGAFARNDNKTGCRIMTVDAVTHLVKGFYQGACKFEPVVEKPQRTDIGCGGGSPLTTKMFMSLVPLRTTLIG